MHDFVACATNFVAHATNFVARATDFVARATDFVACGMLITTPVVILFYFIMLWTIIKSAFCLDTAPYPRIF